MKLFALLLLGMLSGAGYYHASNEYLPSKYSSFSEFIPAKTSNNELIVAFEKLSSKQYSDLNTALNNIPGIKHVGQCESMNIYFFTYDTAVYRSAEDAFEALINHTKIFQPLLKLGASVAAVERACNK